MSCNSSIVGSKYVTKAAATTLANASFSDLASNNNSTLVNQIRKSDNIIDIIPKDKKFNVV